MKKYLLDTNILMSTENYEKMFKDFEGCALIIHPAVIEELDNIKVREVRLDTKQEEQLKHYASMQINLFLLLAT